METANNWILWLIFFRWLVKTTSPLRLALALGAIPGLARAVLEQPSPQLNQISYIFSQPVIYLDKITAR